jgi:hypothetical protein
MLHFIYGVHRYLTDFYASSSKFQHWIMGFQCPIGEL